MKKLMVLVISLILVSVLSIDFAAARSKLFDIDKNSIQRLEIQSGSGPRNTLTISEDSALICEIIDILNNFQYNETQYIGPAMGGYLAIRIIYVNGEEEGINIAPDGAYPPTNDDVKYISIDPNYFGYDFARLLFPCPLTDIDIWRSLSLKFVYDNGFMSGVSETRFSPDTPMTRGMFITALGRMARIDTEDYREDVFNDITEYDYYYPFASWASQKGIAKGTSENNFSPDSPITREQIVLMIGRYADAFGLELTKTVHVKMHFKDIEDTSGEFKDKLAAIFSAGIMRGPSDNDSFEPKSGITRRESADILNETYITLYD